jgi:sporulation protein YlmC with PRC-barrel domain
MLRLSTSYTDRSILSLRTGGQIGLAKQPIINPNNLKVEGWYADDSYEKGDFILPAQEIRDLIAKGLVVNDHDALTHPEDMVRLSEIINLKFSLIGKIVSTESGKKLGKISDYAVNDENYYVQKLYVNPSILHGLTQEQLLIDREQIIEITDKKIIVSDPSVKAGASNPLRAQA